MREIKVRIPEDVNVKICRGKSAAGADHEIISISDLQTLIRDHIMRHLRAQLGPVFFEWEKPEDWRIFRQGEAVRIVVFLELSSRLAGYHVNIKQLNDPREMIVNKEENS